MSFSHLFTRLILASQNELKNHSSSFLKVFIKLVLFLVFVSDRIYQWSHLGLSFLSKKVLNENFDSYSFPISPSEISFDICNSQGIYPFLLILNYFKYPLILFPMPIYFSYILSFNSVSGNSCVLSFLIRLIRILY